MLPPEHQNAMRERVAAARALLARRPVHQAAGYQRHWRVAMRSTLTVLCHDIETILDDLEADDRPPMTEGGA